MKFSSAFALAFAVATTVSAQCPSGTTLVCCDTFASSNSGPIRLLLGLLGSFVAVKSFKVVFFLLTVSLTLADEDRQFVTNKYTTVYFVNLGASYVIFVFIDTGVTVAQTSFIDAPQNLAQAVVGEEVLMSVLQGESIYSLRSPANIH
ncbi:hypothetical protein BDP27DRAFT_1421505 [Rhodocollybia butyracea]|uniref:Uncharacterized protein n=1 Tax=Rhodocollybia butyracea TaxID=206335 RepID=A0A9P5PRU7_9AGAR|nr:hypothetical protein BDP27DRAFT_1421505 [Rhodocollybia butyracea]